MFKHQPPKNHTSSPPFWALFTLFQKFVPKRKVLALISGQWFALSLWLPTCFAVGRAQWGFPWWIPMGRRTVYLPTWNGCFFFNGKTCREIIYQSDGWVMGLWSLKWRNLNLAIGESWPKKTSFQRFGDKKVTAKYHLEDMRFSFFLSNFKFFLEKKHRLHQRCGEKNARSQNLADVFRFGNPWEPTFTYILHVTDLSEWPKPKDWWLVATVGCCGISELKFGYCGICDISGTIWV